MLGSLPGQASGRKLRLFAVACCRKISGYLDSEPDRQGLELTELDVDEKVDEEAFAQVKGEIWDVRWYRREGWDAAWRALESYRTSQDIDEEQNADLKLSNLLREVLGNPFRPVTVEPSPPLGVRGCPDIR
jgi:hypothetical protein